MTRSLEDTRCYDRIVHVYFDLDRLQEYCWSDLAMFGIGIVEEWESVRRCSCRCPDWDSCYVRPKGDEVSGG